MREKEKGRERAWEVRAVGRVIEPRMVRSLDEAQLNWLRPLLNRQFELSSRFGRTGEAEWRGALRESIRKSLGVQGKLISIKGKLVYYPVDSGPLLADHKLIPVSSFF